MVVYNGERVTVFFFARSSGQPPNEENSYTASSMASPRCNASDNDDDGEAADVQARALLPAR